MLRVWLWAGQRVGFRLRLTAARRLAAALAQSEARTEGRASVVAAVCAARQRVQRFRSVTKVW